MSAKYTIVQIVKSSHVNPGESVVADIFISGSGQVDANKVSIYNPHPNLLDSNAGYIQNGIIPAEDDEGREGVIMADADTDVIIENREELSSTGLFGSLNAGYFGENPTLTDRMTDPAGEIDKLPPVMGERTWRDVPPIRVVFNISEDAKPGDYNIPLILTYRSKGELNQVREDIRFHINAFQERLRPWPAIAGIAAVIVALISLIISTIFSVLDFIISAPEGLVWDIVGWALRVFFWSV